jgi:hypothetical protein
LLIGPINTGTDWLEKGLGLPVVNVRFLRVELGKEFQMG